MERWLLIAVLALSAGRVAAQAPPVPPAADAELAIGELDKRMTIEVRIGGRGPWDFIVDTGAERTVVSHELAAELALAPGPQVRVTAMTGTSPAATVIVPAITAGALAGRTIAAPALNARDLGAPGMVGLDALQDQAVTIDFDRDRMTLTPSRRRRRAPAAAGDVVVRAKSLFGQLIVTDARWRGRRIAVVVDTGTPMSIGNTALRRLMTNARPAGGVTLVSATGGLFAAEVVAANDVEVGGIGFRDMAVAIGDAAPFARFGLSDTPALLMGMDVLRLFRVVRIDYANREIRFSLPRDQRRRS